jgi:hypothetical protein
MDKYDLLGSQSDFIAVDLDTLLPSQSTVRNALVYCGGSTLYKTKRGRNAVHLKKKVFERVCRDHRVAFEPGLDGTAAFIVAETPSTERLT